MNLIEATRWAELSYKVTGSIGWVIIWIVLYQINKGKIILILRKK